MVVCGHCGNNCCNGCSGEGCPDKCEEAYRLQENPNVHQILSIDHEDVERTMLDLHEKLMDNYYELYGFRDELVNALRTNSESSMSGIVEKMSKILMNCRY